MSNIVTQSAEARQKGETVFLSGKRCKYGHNTARSAITGRCIECRESERFRSANRAMQRARYIKRTDEQRLYANAQHLKWQRAHPERQAAMAKRWRLNNPDKVQMYHAKQAAKKAALSQSSDNFAKKTSVSVIVPSSNSCM